MNKALAIIITTVILTSCSERGWRILDITASATDTVIAVSERKPLTAIDSAIETTEKTVDSVRKTKLERDERLNNNTN